MNDDIVLGILSSSVVSPVVFAHYPWMMGCPVNWIKDVVIDVTYKVNDEQHHFEDAILDHIRKRLPCMLTSPRGCLLRGHLERGANWKVNL